jgi:NhaP-type Na+/H+ or K+/H+ antiporter
MDISAILVVAALIVGFGLVSRRLDGSVVTPPMVFVATGLAVGPHALGWIEVTESETTLHVLGELTLVLVLFGDASRIDLSALRRELGLPVRLLGLGLPLTIALGAGAAKLLFPQLSWFEAGVLGTVLAPTDAALGQAVVASPAVPLRVRQALNVESGLNDGIALPVVMVLAALGSMVHAETKSTGEWATFVTFQVTLGPIVGVVVALAGVKLVDAAARRSWVDERFLRLSGVGLALFTFAGAEAVGGNGLIAAFVGGLTLGHLARDQCEGLHHFLEAEGQLSMLLVFLLLGAALLWPSLSTGTAVTFLYAALSLTVVRMAPAALSLVGSRVRLPTTGFLGWFGPRGVASALFAILIISEADLPHAELIFATTMVTVALSVFAHGLTAAPFAAAYGKLAEDPERCPAEHEEVHDHPLRLSERIPT